MIVLVILHPFRNRLDFSNHKIHLFYHHISLLAINKILMLILEENERESNESGEQDSNEKSIIEGDDSSEQNASRTESKEVQKAYNPNDNKIQLDDSVKDIDEVRKEGRRPPLKSSFDDTKKIKIQITWKNITIKAPPRAGMCKKVDPNAESFTILGKK